MVRPEDAANYLIILYKNTKFQCDRKKLQKLVIYTDLLYYAMYHEKFIEPDCITATSKGLSIDRLSNGIYDCYFNFDNNSREINNSEIKYSIDESLNSAYEYDKNALNTDQINLLRYMFKKLGAYSGDDLTIMSKETDLWQKAREDLKDNKDPVINEDMYDKFLGIIGISDSDDNEIKKNKILNYLKDKLKSKLECEKIAYEKYFGL